jgi:hypothetical protein
MIAFCQTILKMLPFYGNRRYVTVFINAHLLPALNHANLARILLLHVIKIPVQIILKEGTKISLGKTNSDKYTYLANIAKFKWNCAGWTVEFRWGRDFSHLSRPSLGPTQPPAQWVPGLFRGVQSGRGVTLTPHPLLVPRSKNRVELYFYCP